VSVFDRIAYLQGRRDELPNQELAKELAESGNTAGIREIAGNMFNKDINIQSDCIKVLYEAGYIKPEIIAGYAGDFIKLLRSGNNRFVWGAMIALSTIANLKADEIYKNLDTIYKVIKEGSVITVDNGIKVLAAVASKNDEYNKAIFPYLIDHLRKCRPKEVSQHAESTFIAVTPSNRDEFINVLKGREISQSASQLARFRKIYKKFYNKFYGDIMQ
jgi:hypothetical protein